MENLKLYNLNINLNINHYEEKTILNCRNKHNDNGLLASSCADAARGYTTIG
ncbi:hypothetical protein JCM15124A_08730 [Prevotella falsenii]